MPGVHTRLTSWIDCHLDASTVASATRSCRLAVARALRRRPMVSPGVTALPTAKRLVLEAPSSSRSHSSYWNC
eukprot:2411213-Lingulodinium_polyedra.AAC.1